MSGASSSEVERILLSGNLPKVDGGDVDTDPLSYLYTVLKTGKAIKEAVAGTAEEDKIKKIVDNEMYYIKQAISILGDDDAKFAQLRMAYGGGVDGARKLANSLQEFHKSKVLEAQMVQAAGGSASTIASGKLQAGAYFA